MRKPGRHFLQIPGPSTVPDRILRAIDFPTMDHRSPEFGELGLRALNGMRTIFGTSGDVIIYPASGTGAWEAALVNTLSSGDTVLICETGQFAWLWQTLARRLGLKPDVIETDWRQAADGDAIGERLRADTAHQIKAVCVVHNETSTGCTSNIAAVRAAMDAAKHPALLMVDTISSLGSVEYRHDAWGVDVTIGGSQKGLMLPPGLSFNAISEKAKAASKTATLPRSYWDWFEMIAANRTGFFPYTPATNLLYGLVEALDMLHEEGLEAVYARHIRHGEATRLAVQSWGLDVLCRVPEHYSPVLTAVMVPGGHSADALRGVIHRELNMSLGNGLGRLQDKVFRIGHLGDFNDLMLLGTLSGIEMGLVRAGIPHKKGGAQAAIDFLANAEIARATERVA
ncbi:MAG TPA: aminotransferase class V-fold PLP-dependent enzyme [Paracoccaceae bacterium]|nr:aminotransferase class V-fold PLP-dependent enzyme [Paracoccaceae bacterium]